MAFQGEGADWLQGDRDVRNPYYGPSMLTCGEVTEEIVTGAPAEEADRDSE